MTVFVSSTTGLVDETPCAGCGWPVCSCLCEADDLVDWKARAEAERDALREALQSLVDGKSEFDIEYGIGMPAD